MYKLTIARFELYPKDEPTGYVVGFNVELDNGRSFYVDGVVDLDEANGKSDEEIVSAAYKKLKGQIQSLVAALVDKSPILGKEFTPSDEE